jgi:branched-chain amino acid transport system permease protein
MKFYKKTDYLIDIRLFRDGPMAAWYALLAVVLLIGPLATPEYLLGQAVFTGIYVVAGAGLMLLSGYCGQISLGHAAFLAVGVYTSALLEKAGVPFPFALLAAGAVAAATGVVIGIPALRLSGIYLAIATLAYAFIVTEVLLRWESLTNGASGIYVSKINIFGLQADSELKLYYIVLIVAVLSMLAVRNILRSPLGLAMMAVRDSETAARTMGVPVARVKLTAFALSAALTGFAGALYAHKVPFIEPEQFNILISVELLVLIFIGGIGSLHGIVFGAVFVISLPQWIAIAKDYLPPYITQQTGLQAAIYGLLLLLFIVFEPSGLYGIWLKIKHYFSMFPFYRKGAMRLQKTHAKSETW